VAEAQRVLLTGRAEDGPAAVELARRLAEGGAHVTPWLVPGGPRDDDALLHAARAAVDREVRVPAGPGADWPLEGVDDDPRADRQALVLCERMLGLAEGEHVLVEGTDLGLPLLRRVLARARAAGAHVSLRVAVDDMARTVLEASDVEALGAPDVATLAAVGAAQATLRLTGERRYDALAGVAPERLSARTRSAEPVRSLRFEATAAGRLRWALTAVPCPAYAELAGLSEAAYADLLYAAAGCDVADPIGLWARRAEVQAALRDRLEAGGELRFRGPGTDVSMSVSGRRWRSSAANRNLPDGEVFSGPVEDSAEGVATFGVPTMREGRRVTGARIVLRRGEVVEATAEDGEDVLRAAVALDEGSRRLGEVGIGTNYGLPQATGMILLDEKIGGTFHLALGAGYPETGSVNRSAEHWDLISDLRAGGEILLDGEPLQRDGRFLGGLQDGL
jgi:aminopeptidase